MMGKIMSVKNGAGQYKVRQPTEGRKPTFYNQFVAWHGIFALARLHYPIPNASTKCNNNARSDGCSTPLAVSLAFSEYFAASRHA